MKTPQRSPHRAVNQHQCRLMNYSVSTTRIRMQCCKIRSKNAIPCQLFRQQNRHKIIFTKTSCRFTTTTQMVFANRKDVRVDLHAERGSESRSQAGHSRRSWRRVRVRTDALRAVHLCSDHPRCTSMPGMNRPSLPFQLAPNYF